jgi:hypothetical protein
VTPTADDFRALARSSPWRWTTLHFRHSVAGQGHGVEAWLARPDRLLVRHDRHDERHDGWPYGSSGLAELLWPTAFDPVLRSDGLVAERPDDWRIKWGDPMYTNYQWVAMLDPVELSHHVDVADVREGERFGRPTWEARVAAVDGYDPRCACCPLIRSEIADRYEYDDGSGAWMPPPETSYPTAYDVALDVATSVVVRSEAIGVEDGGLDFEVEILEVDADQAGRSSASTIR